MRRLLLVLAALGPLFVGACRGSSATAPSPVPATPPAPVALSATLSDVAGDALPHPRTITPDLTSGSITVEGSNLRFRLTFDEASLANLATAFAQIYMDLDENPSTGIRGIQEVVDRETVGADAVLTVREGWAQMELIRCNGLSCRVAATVPISRSGGVVTGVAPMSAIDDDGRMTVKMSTYVIVDGVGLGRPADVMPDGGLPPVPVR